MSKKKKREKRVVSARGRVEKHTGGFDSGSLVLPDGVNLFTAKAAGTIRIDIMPYVVGKGNPMASEGDLYFERTYWTHRGIGPNNKTVVCLAKTYDKKCPICEERARMANDDDVDSKAVDALKPKERQLFAVIDINDRKKGIQIWDISHYLFGKALDAKVRNGDDGEYDLFADLEQGLTVKIGATEEKGAGYKFIDCSEIEFKPRTKTYDEDMLDKVPCLDDLIKEESYKKLKEMFMQVGNDEEDDDEDEDDTDDEDDDVDEDDSSSKKKKKSKAPAKDKKKKPKDDEDEEDDEDEGDEDEDEDEGDEDEDEDDEPSSKKKKGKEAPKGKGPAHKMGFKEGMVVEHEDLGECVIKHISSDGTTLRLEDEDGELHKAIDPEECEILEKKEKAKKDKDKKAAPAKTKGKGKKSKDEDDDDDDEDEDEDDDD